MAFLNIKFPFEENDKGYFLQDDLSSTEAIRSNLILLLTTDKEDIYYFPEYGTNLKRHLFEPKDGITRSDIVAEINQSVKKFLPSVNIDDISTQDGENDTQLIVVVTYTSKIGSLRQTDTIYLDLS